MSFHSRSVARPDPYFLLSNTPSLPLPPSTPSLPPPFSLPFLPPPPTSLPLIHLTLSIFFLPFRLMHIPCSCLLHILISSLSILCPLSSHYLCHVLRNLQKLLISIYLRFLFSLTLSLSLILTFRYLFYAQVLFLTYLQCTYC
jgi:hypothetical protein